MPKPSAYLKRFIELLNEKPKLQLLLFAAIFALAGTFVVIRGFASSYVTTPCGSPPATPQPISHVIWIVFENHGANQIKGNSSNPYMNSLASECGYANNMRAISHPSLPNYIALTSGSIQGLAGDDSDPSAHTFNVPNIYQQLEAAGKSWKGLAEDMPSACDKNNSGNYAVRHNPAAYFTNINCAANDLPLNVSGTVDLSSNFTFVTPNLCNDAHDCSPSVADQWLKSFMENHVLNSAQYADGSTAVFVTFDEDENDLPSPSTPIPFYVISPYVTPSHESQTAYDHYSTLGTTEDLLGLGRIAGSVGAASLVDDFGLKPPTNTPTSPKPTVTLTASPQSIVSGRTSTLQWSAQNATSCAASGAWSAAQPTSGSFTTPALTATSTFTLQCTGPGGTTSASAVVTVTAANTPPPTPDPSGQALPVGDLSGWHQVFADDFTINAATGTWGTSDASKVVYTGDHGGKWVEYPDGWPSTYTNGQVGYVPAQVLSVHDGTLDFNLHPVNGLPAGANPSPILASGTQYQAYGRYSARVKVSYSDAQHLDAYHMAWLLWPNNDSDWQLAESDFPETTLNDPNLCAYAHFGGSGDQDSYCKSTDMTQWHTYTQEWGPGYRKYYIDSTLIGTSTNQVFSNPERWQLQTEPSGTNDSSSGHLLVDWVAAYSYSPTTNPPAAPTVSLTSPANNSTVSGQVDVSAVASSTVSRVDFYVDDQLVKSDKQPVNNTYSYTWDTTQNTTNGQHTVTAKAFDSSSSTPGTAAATVNVNNSVAMPPDAPANVQAQVNGSGQVQLSWTAPTNTSVASYQITRTGGGANVTSSVAGSTTTYADDTVQANTSYTYTVKAVNIVGLASTASTAVKVTTPAPPAKLQTVTLSSPSDGQQVDGSVTIAADVTAGTNPISSVEFEVDGVPVPNCAFGPSSRSTYVCTWDSSSAANGSHVIAVRVTDTSQSLVIDHVTVQVQHADSAAPGVPGKPTVKAPSYKQVSVTWPVSADTGGSGLAGYYVLRSTGSAAGPFTTIGQTAAGTTTFADATVNAKTSYTYEIEAFDSAGNVSAPSASATVMTPDTTVPQGSVTIPDQLSAVADSATQINLAWKASSAPAGIAGYDVYRNSVKVATVLQTSYGDADLEADTSYSYYVIAKDKSGAASHASDTVTATTLSGGGAFVLYGTITNAKDKHLVPHVLIAYTHHHGAHFTYSNDVGEYRLTDLAVGKKEISFSKPQYKRQEYKVRVRQTGQVKHDVHLLLKSHKHDNDRVGDD